VAPGLGDFGVSYTVHLWLVGKRVVDFILALIELFSVALTVEALRANNLSKLRCLKEGVGHSSVRRVRQKCLLPFVCTAAKQFWLRGHRRRLHLRVDNRESITQIWISIGCFGVIALGVSTKLLYVEPGQYWDGWSFRFAGAVLVATCRPTQSPTLGGMRSWETSTGQKAVQLYGWDVKAPFYHFIDKRFRDRYRPKSVIAC